MGSLKRLRPLMKPYNYFLFFMVITVILTVTMELLVPSALRYIIDVGIKNSNMQAIWQGVAVMLLAALVGAMATLGQGVCRARISQGLAYDIRNKMFAHIQSFSFSNLDKMQAGKLMTRISSDVDMVRHFMSAGLALLLRALLMISGSVVMMFFIDWQLALIMLLLLPLAGVLITGVMVLSRPMFTVVQQKLGVLNTSVQENLAGVQVVKAFVRERYEMRRFRGLNEAYMGENIKVGRLTAVAMPLLAVITNVGIVVIVLFGGLSVISGRLSLGELVAFNSYLLIGMAPVLLLGNVLTMVSRAQASADRVFEVLDTRPAVKIVEAPHRSESLKGRVEFEHVSFHYDSAEVSEYGRLNQAGNTTRYGGGNVLNDVSLIVEPGQQIAILGATGSGKSSLIHLIPRFYDVFHGRILIDDVDVRDWEPEALRKQIGVVLQQTTLFSGTIFENIAYGRPHASLDEVVAAAKAAQAHEFITKMPEGYDSFVEERGANLSGGQKQRIAIARALFISPSILIMDDSTSAVDMETEASIQEALVTLMAQRTTFIVAQRITSVLQADQIMVLEHGRLLAQGNHESLLATSPIYQEIYQSQLGDGAPVAGQTGVAKN
jgi:ATP-binding cassette subfamily B multidrug efflux pump